MADITRTEQCEYVKGELEYMLHEMMNFVNRTMAYKGDTCSESQKICLYNALTNVEANINGIEPADIIFEEDE